MTTPLFADRTHPDIICLFDVDGTLTPARLKVTESMEDTLVQLRKKCVVGFVGGSDLSKQIEQLGSNVLQNFDYCFSENGLTAYKMGVQLASQSFIGYLGEERYKKLVNYVLRYIADMDIPVKRGTFVEFRNGMINISPIGRNCSHAERIEFEKFDLEHKLREKFVAALQNEFSDYGLTFAIGGQISFDVFPNGWDKTYCLRHIEEENFREIHFFGDKTFKGGNDYEIFSDPRVIGHAVTSPEDTEKILRELFLK
ncbi:MAG: eukaryotic phosphomannomutase [Benniella sp.]|nr:MAG: eukaryotic phosphomannomutase [Benniella sp.]